jgi:hypothetical protein
MSQQTRLFAKLQLCTRCLLDIDPAQLIFNDFLDFAIRQIADQRPPIAKATTLSVDSVQHSCETPSIPGPSF